MDDAIIAVETMAVKLEQGWDRMRAAAFAYTSTAFPMLTGTLVTVAGFLPIALAVSQAYHTVPFTNSKQLVKINPYCSVPFYYCKNVRISYRSSSDFRIHSKETCIKRLRVVAGAQRAYGYGRG